MAESLDTNGLDQFYSAAIKNGRHTVCRCPGSGSLAVQHAIAGRFSAPATKKSASRAICETDSFFKTALGLGRPARPARAKKPRDVC